jgi:hypothetical protein
VALAMARRKEFEGRMLAILDPELRHSTPSRRQSAMLIATLALVSLTVGAVSPAPRTTSAASVGIESDVAAHGIPAYPDSGVPGVTSIATSMQKETHQSAHTTTSSSIVIASSSATETASAQPQPRADTLRGLLTGKSAQQGGRSDDRPILLAKVLRTDTSAALRRIAAWGLSEYGSSPVAAEALSNALLHDADVKVREMAAWALGEGDDGTSAATAALSAALRSDANEHVREVSAWALGQVGGHAAVEALSAALSDAGGGVRTRAIWALGNVEPKQAPKALVEALKDKDPRVRHMTAWALFRIEDPSTAQAIEAALKVEQDKEVQLGEIRALAAMGERSVDALRGLLESSDPRVKAMAVRALAGGHAAGPWPWPWPDPRPYP